MKKFITKVQDLSQRAQQFQQMVASAPPKIAELREQVLATAGQFQAARADVQSTFGSLRAENEQRLLEALREIDAHAGTFADAGYHLDDVEMELAIPQRLIVHLEKVADVGSTRLRSLLAANEANPTTHGILNALVKAEEMADKVDLTNLGYHGLTVYVGAVPTVRLGWCAPTKRQASVTAPPALPVPASAPASAPSAAAGSAFGSSFFDQGSFFERRTPAAVSTTQAEPTLSAAAPLPQPAVSTTAPEPPAAAAPEVAQDPLARFKKMPNLSR